MASTVQMRCDVSPKSISRDTDSTRDGDSAGPSEGAPARTDPRPTGRYRATGEYRAAQGALTGWSPARAAARRRTRRRVQSGRDDYRPDGRAEPSGRARRCDVARPAGLLPHRPPRGARPRAAHLINKVVLSSVRGHRGCGSSCGGLSVWGACVVRPYARRFAFPCSVRLRRIRHIVLR